MIIEAIFTWAERQPATLAVATPGVALDYAALVHAVRARASTLAGAGQGVLVLRGDDPATALIDMLAARCAGRVPLVLGPEEHALSSEPALAAETAWLSATGGTTGAARLIAFSDVQTDVAARTHARMTDLAAGAELVVTVPPWTSYGRNCWLGALVTGATLRYVPPTAPRELLGALTGERVTWGCTTPPVVRALARLPAAIGADARHGRPAPAALMSSAAPYPAEAAALVAERHGVLVYERYGLTEVGPVGMAREPGGALWPVPELTLRIAGEPPALEVEGAAVALGVVGGPTFNGHFRTADRVELQRSVASGEQEFRVVGRIDRVVKRMARLVDLAALERAVAAVPGVAHARVRVQPGTLDLDLVAQVAPLPGQVLDAGAISAQLAESLPPWERPTRIEVVPADDQALDLTKWTARA